MGFPGEEFISSAIEKFADGVIHKMDQAEERRNREFAYKLKELEFYKGNYEKEIKGIFDKWFNFLQDTLIANNKNAHEDVKKKYQKRIDSFLQVENAMKLKIDTMKYGGTETGKVLAVFSQLSFDSDKYIDTDKFVIVYVVCLLLSTLKKEILGQEINPMTMLQVLLNDFETNYDIIKNSKDYVENKYQILLEHSGS
ncbi:MAG: hypothetical protein IJ766_05095 [Clostridia bacterium]|nr:hypothetical protein [Clostridia bacterium]